MPNTLHPLQFFVDPANGVKSVRGVGRNQQGNFTTIKETDIDFYTAWRFEEPRSNYPTGYAEVQFHYGERSHVLLDISLEDETKLVGFFAGKKVELDATGQIIPSDTTSTTETTQPTMTGMSEDVAQIKMDLNTLGLSIATIFGKLAEIAPTVYGSFRLEVVAATDTTPMHADLFGLDVIDADPRNENTDTVVCSINMLGADMCQHKQFPDQPDDNQWVIEVLSANGLKHRFHTHSAGDFGLIFDAIRAGETTKVYSTRPTPPQQPSPSSGSET